MTKIEVPEQLTWTIDAIYEMFQHSIASPDDVDTVKKAAAILILARLEDLQIDLSPFYPDH